MQQIVDDAYALAANATLEGTKTLTGVISEINKAFNDQYGNITVTIKVAERETKPIQCFRMVAKDGEEELVVGIKTLAVGDTITVSGTLKNFVKNDTSTIEFDEGCILEAITKAGSGEGGNEGGETPATDTKSYWIKIAQNSASVNKVLYFNGATDATQPKFLGTTEDTAEAQIVHLEAAEGGYNLTFTDSTGAKKYIAVEQNGTGKAKVGIADAPGAVFTYNETYDTYYVSLDQNYYLGTYSTYTTISASKSSYLEADGAVDVSQFPARLVEATGSGTPSTETTYYVMKVAQNNASVNKVLYFNGAPDATQTKFLGTTEKLEEAAQIELEETTGGYNMTFTDSTGAKKYIAVEQNGTGKAKVSIADAPGAVFTYNETYDTYYVALDQNFYLGTYSTYTTISASKSSYLEAAGAVDVSQFPARLVKATEAAGESGSQGGNEGGQGGNEGGQGGEGGQTTDPVLKPTKDVYTVDEIVAILADYADNQISSEEFTVTGTATESSYNSGYKSYTVWLESNGDKTKTKALQLYSAQLATTITANYQAVNAMAGATLTCKGYLKKYVKDNETTPELSYLSATNSPTGAAASPLISSLTGGTPASGNEGGSGSGSGSGTQTGGTVLDFTAQNYTNAQAVTTLTADKVTITFSKGTGSTAPAYYTSGTAVRTYTKNTFTITVSGTTATKIVFTLGNKTDDCTANVGDFEINGKTATWTGDSNSIVFSVSEEAKMQFHIQKIEVTTK